MFMGPPTPMSVVTGEERGHGACEFARCPGFHAGEDIEVLALDDNRLKMRDQRRVAALRMQELVDIFRCRYNQYPARNRGAPRRFLSPPAEPGR